MGFCFLDAEFDWALLILLKVWAFPLSCVMRDGDFRDAEFLTKCF